VANAPDIKSPCDLAIQQCNNVLNNINTGAAVKKNMTKPQKSIRQANATVTGTATTGAGDDKFADAFSNLCDTLVKFESSCEKKAKQFPKCDMKICDPLTKRPNEWKVCLKNFLDCLKGTSANNNNKIATNSSKKASSRPDIQAVNDRSSNTKFTKVIRRIVRRNKNNQH